MAVNLILPVPHMNLPEKSAVVALPVSPVSQSLLFSGVGFHREAVFHLVETIRLRIPIYPVLPSESPKKMHKFNEKVQLL